MNDGLYGYGQSLEDIFFRKRDAELIEQHRKLEKIKRTRNALSEVSGIHNHKVLDKLIALDVSAEILSSLAVVPLIEVAWADGKVDDTERKAILACVDKNDMEKGSVDYALLENWLKHRPPVKMLDAWMHYIEGLCEIMNEAEINSFKKEIMDRAHKIAESTGGLLGIGEKISPQERTILKKMESAFLKK